ncbi:hypothetical protein H6F76_11415 [Leptolyngbya sp. FACHB-321]|uniref:hypothetical protein n=1 Tax=Leptolyngbya sp. FACHB-321 TaxID=2692807 RepID=UPI00168884B5|nr:hypothetical protein [Leptolyngbya sp. FACHB-321]MBD2035628.1 hypothetical protein [Leptolyngbya sp. FACHB-321]
MPLITAIAALFSQPPIPFKPEQQTLKGWAMYCLRDRGFKVIYAQNADFAVETREGSKVYFSVTEDATNLDKKIGWIVRDSATNQITVIPPQS